MLESPGNLIKGPSIGQVSFPLIIALIGIAFIGFGFLETNAVVIILGTLFTGVGIYYYLFLIKGTFVTIDEKGVSWKSQFLSLKALRYDEIESMGILSINSHRGKVKVISFYLKGAKREEHLPFDYKDMDQVISALSQRIPVRPFDNPLSKK